MQSGKREDLLKRVGHCIQGGNHQNLDPRIDNGKWFAAKVMRQNSAQLRAKETTTLFRFQ